MGKCELCLVCDADSKHHLIPGDSKQPKVALCDPCHTAIHTHFTNKELRKSLYTIELLRETSEMSRWIEWRVRHASSTVTARMSNARKDKGRYA